MVYTFRISDGTDMEHLILASGQWSWQEVSYSYRLTKAVWDFDDDIYWPVYVRWYLYCACSFQYRYDLDESCLLNIVKAKWVNGNMSICCLTYVFDGRMFKCMKKKKSHEFWFWMIDLVGMAGSGEQFHSPFFFLFLCYCFNTRWGRWGGWEEKH